MKKDQGIYEGDFSCREDVEWVYQVGLDACAGNG